jgi:glyoxylase-like metal-dependent hydrolase (beta-lactamase superfamily II)
MAWTFTAHEAARGHVTCTITDTIREGAKLPGGVQAYEIGVPYASEVVYFLPAHGALIFGDCLVGAGGGRVRIMPASWVDKDAPTQERYRTIFLPSLTRLLDLSPALLLTSHGAPVLDNAPAALAAALASPASTAE